MFLLLRFYLWPLNSIITILLWYYHNIGWLIIKSYFLLHKAPCWSDLHSNSVKLLKGPFNSEEEIWQRSNFHQSRSEEFHTAVKHQMNFTRVELWPLTFSGGVNTGEDPPGSAGKTFIILNISQHLKMDRWTPEFKILTNIETQ